MLEGEARAYEDDRVRMAQENRDLREKFARLTNNSSLNDSLLNSSLTSDEQQQTQLLPVRKKQRDRVFHGMLEFRKDDLPKILRALILG
jgi:hypothetical protein